MKVSSENLFLPRTWIRGIILFFFSFMVFTPFVKLTRKYLDPPDTLKGTADFFEFESEVLDNSCLQQKVNNLPIVLIIGSSTSKYGSNHSKKLETSFVYPEIMANFFKDQFQICNFSSSRIQSPYEVAFIISALIDKEIYPSYIIFEGYHFLNTTPLFLQMKESYYDLLDLAGKAWFFHPSLTASPDSTSRRDLSKGIYNNYMFRYRPELYHLAPDDFFHSLVTASDPSSILRYFVKYNTFGFAYRVNTQIEPSAFEIYSKKAGFDIERFLYNLYYDEHTHRYANNAAIMANLEAITKQLPDWLQTNILLLESPLQPARHPYDSYFESLATLILNKRHHVKKVYTYLSTFLPPNKSKFTDYTADGQHYSPAIHQHLAEQLINQIKLIETYSTLNSSLQK